MNRLSNISFKATPEELKAIKRACNNLSDRLTNDKTLKAAVNTPLMQNRFFISTKPQDATNRLKLELRLFNLNKDSFTLKSIKNDDIEGMKKFLKNPTNQEKIADYLDELKALLRKMNSFHGE